VPVPPPTAVLSESTRELTELIDPLMTVLMAVLELAISEVAVETATDVLVTTPTAVAMPSRG